MNKLKASLRLMLVCLALFVQGCGPNQKNTAATTLPVLNQFQVPGATDTPSPTALELSPTPSAVPSLTPVPTAVMRVVTVSAVDGNLFIRRGPDLGFDPVGVLMKGQSTSAIARDPLVKWLQVPLLDPSGKTGWISIQTSYSTVQGDLMALPELAPTAFPVPAFLQNCTYDQMQVEPGGIVIPSFSYFPDNRVQINPGTYTVHDTTLTGSPEVMDVELREGLEIDIRVDGYGHRRKCPLP